MFNDKLTKDLAKIAEGIMKAKEEVQEVEEATWKSTGHYTEDGKEWDGDQHYDEKSGMVMTGKTHDADSQNLYHYKDLSPEARTKVKIKEEVELDEAGPKIKGDFLKIQRAKDAAHDDAMGRTKTGRKKPERTMTSTQKSMASMRNEEKLAGWIAMFNGKQVEIYKDKDAKDLYSAKLFAIKALNVPKSKQGLLSVEPAYEEVQVAEAFKVGKQDMIVVIQGPGDNNQKVLAVFKGIEEKKKALKFKDDWNEKNGDDVKKDKNGKPISSHLARVFTLPNPGGTREEPKVGSNVGWSLFSRNLISEEDLDEAVTIDYNKGLDADDMDFKNLAKKMKIKIKVTGRDPNGFDEVQMTFPDMKTVKQFVKMTGIDLDEDFEITEAKPDYDIKHKTFSSAIQHAVEVAMKRGYEVDPDDYDRKVAMGPKKPSEGKTNSYSLKLMKDGKEQRKALQVQIANLDNKFYELNMYIQ